MAESVSDGLFIDNVWIVPEVFSSVSSIRYTKDATRDTIM